MKNSHIAPLIVLSFLLLSAVIILLELPFILGMVCLVVGMFLLIRKLAAPIFKAAKGPVVIGKILEIKLSKLIAPQTFERLFILTVQFETVDGQQVVASGDLVIYPEDQVLFQPGSSVALRYDPENTKQINISDNKDLERVLDEYRVERRGGSDEILTVKYGVKATGVILSSQPTGNIVNGCEEMALQLKVSRPDGETYEVTINKTVSQDDLPSAQPGSEVKVYYSQWDEKDIAILFQSETAS